MRQPIDIDYVSKAIVGIASPVLGVVTSFQEQIEWHLRVASLLVGLAEPNLAIATGLPCLPRLGAGGLRTAKVGAS